MFARITSVIFLVVALGGQGVLSQTCPDVAIPRWGRVSCTEGSNSGSVCTLSCNEYYDLGGTTEDSIEVTCQSTGVWSGSTEFECAPIRCFPAHQAPVNGDLICSATNLAQSICVFLCNDGYDMAGTDSDRTAYTVCRDDGNGDEFGEWTTVADTVQFPPSFPPVCERIACTGKIEAPVNGQVMCSNDGKVGSSCVVLCNPGYRFKDRKESILSSWCKDDGNLDNKGQWTLQESPPCEKCPRVKDVDLLALIHDSENDPQQFKVAATMISKVTVFLKRRYRMQPTVRVNRYSDTVNATNELYMMNFQPVRGRQKIEGIPFSGRGVNTEQALNHVNDRLNGQNRMLVAFLLTNEMRDYNEDVEKLARDLRARGVMIFVFTIPQKNRAQTWLSENLVKLTGDADLVYNLLTQRSTELYRGRVAGQIAEMATRKGCDNSE